ncbi:uncharacterized protein LOC119726314 [Patiria miniata]|uniref:Uncharacterized protein n=1 Tax=Patiria miniata TaxID=46514 RepID=A0A913ZQ43_PATMI|nr:uncharacterized protein LOC119726314 [Patiria miniata]
MFIVVMVTSQLSHVRGFTTDPPIDTYTSASGNVESGSASGNDSATWSGNASGDVDNGSASGSASGDVDDGVRSESASGDLSGSGNGSASGDLDSDSGKGSSSGDLDDGVRSGSASGDLSGSGNGNPSGDLGGSGSAPGGLNGSGSESTSGDLSCSGSGNASGDLSGNGKASADYRGGGSGSTSGDMSGDLDGGSGSGSASGDLDSGSGSGSASGDLDGGSGIASGNLDGGSGSGSISGDLDDGSGSGSASGDLDGGSGSGSASGDLDGGSGIASGDLDGGSGSGSASGDSGIGSGTEDVDECQSSESVCPAMAYCTNTHGSFRCHCQDGYTLTGQPESSKFFCMDIDECQDEALYDCHSNATCINEPGAYRCMCSETQGYHGDGRICTPLDLCESGPCLNQGQCTSSVGSGSYECVCTEDFTGVNCGIRVVPQGAPAVTVHPTPRVTVRKYQTVTLECGFENVASFAWYKNGEMLPGTAGVSFLTLAGVSLTDRGYYWCQGRGFQGVTLQTNSSLVLILGVSSFTAHTRYPTLTFVDSLKNKNSEEFQNTSAQITSFLTGGLLSRGIPASVFTKELSSGSVLATTEILIEQADMTSDRERVQSIHGTLQELAASSDGFLELSSISIQSSGSCVESTWPSIYGPITFPAGSLGFYSESSPGRLCPDYTINGGQIIARAVCLGDGFSVAYWFPENQPELMCGRNLTIDEKLALLSEVPVTEENVMVVASRVVSLTDNATMLGEGGVDSTATIVENIASVNVSNTQVTISVVQTASNLIDIDDELLREVQMKTHAPTRIARSLEQQLQTVPDFREISPNVGVEVRTVPEATLLRGLSFTSLNSTEYPFEESSLTIMDSEDISLGYQGGVSEMPHAILMLPPEVNILARRDDSGGVRVSFSVFRKGSLFQSLSLADFNKGEERFNRTINTRVMSATVGSQPITNLNEPVTILLSKLDNASFSNNTRCVFWNADEEKWSSEGCRLRENYVTDQYLACQCDHLTNFAALTDIYSESPLTETQEFILKLLSLVGCGMSILGLLIIMVTYLSYRQLRSGLANKILLSLCASLLCLYITFVVATALDSERGVAELDVLPCCVLAGFLHYFTLTSLCWMGVEGLNMYLMFVRVVNVYVPKFMLKASLAAWGIPVFIVAITAGATRQNYVGTDFCFLQQIPLIAGLLAPIGLILLFNIVVFSLVMRQFIKTSNNDLRRNRDDMSKRKLHKQRLQNALTVMTLMGLTWSIGYLNLVQAISFPVQLVFCLLNTLQGYFIFMFYGVRRAEVRKQWRSFFSFTLQSETAQHSSSEGARSSRAPMIQPHFDPRSVPKPPTEIYRARSSLMQ